MIGKYISPKSRSHGGQGPAVRGVPTGVRCGCWRWLESVWFCWGRRWQVSRARRWEVTVGILSGLNKKTRAKQRHPWSLRRHP